MEWVEIPIFFCQMEEVIERITKLAAGLLEEKGAELVEISYKRRGPDMVLRLLVDKRGPQAGGITLSECGWLNEKLGEALDRENVLTGRYLLEVCSPGLDRPLKTKRDFDWAVGRLVRIHTYGPVEDKREHIGKIISRTDTAIIIELKGGTAKREIPLDKISKACLEF